MELISMKVLRKSPLILNNIRWDVTPRIFFNPSSTRDASGNVVDVTRGYMLYVDMMEDRPALVIMNLKPITSKTVGYVLDIPEELLRGAMNCSGSECIGGMYPLSEQLENWLKKEFGMS